MVDEASEFTREHKESPFFMYFALNTPHYPYQGEANWLKRYRNLPYPRNFYAAFVSTIDTRIGRLMRALDNLDLRKDTIVVYQSDHGHSHEERAHFGGGSAGPYRGAKFSLFEGGIRVPAIISWPGKIAEDEERSVLAHSCDWVPTVAELYNVPLDFTTIDGKSLVPVLRSAEAKTPHDIVHWIVGRNPDSAQWAVRQSEWKLIGNPRDTSQKSKLTDADALFLANLATAPDEMTNLANQHPDVVDELRILHESWLKDLE